MNIIEALKTNLRLKRPSYDRFLENDYVLRMLTGTAPISALPSSDVLANDWEVEEEKITLTKGEFLKTVSITMVEISSKNGYILKYNDEAFTGIHLNSFNGWKELCENLGFKS